MSPTLNAGVSGDATQHVLWRLQAPELARLQPERVLIVLGTNNLARDKPHAIVAGLEAVVDRVTDLWRPAEIVMLPIPPRGQGQLEFDDVRTLVNQGLDEAARTRPWLRVVDVAEVLVAGHRVGVASYLQDMLPFTRAGYAAVSAAMSALLG